MQCNKRKTRYDSYPIVNPSGKKKEKHCIRARKVWTFLRRLPTLQWDFFFILIPKHFCLLKISDAQIYIWILVIRKICKNLYMPYKASNHNFLNRSDFKKKYRPASKINKVDDNQRTILYLKRNKIYLSKPAGKLELEVKN